MSTPITPAPSFGSGFAGAGTGASAAGVATVEARLRAVDARRARLLELRSRLTALSADLSHGRAMIPGENPSWRSAAARAYQGKIDEVRTHFGAAASLLDEALARISSRLAALVLERQSAETELAARRSMALLHQEAAAGEDGRRYL